MSPDTFIKNFYDDELWNSFHYNNLFEDRENEIAYQYYDYEIRLCSAIKHGDEENVRNILLENLPGEYVRLADHPLRSAINRGIVSISLFSRSAIQGGLRYEEALSICDNLIRYLERCKDLSSVLPICQRTALFYAHLVHEQKNPNLLQKKLPDTPNEHIELCKDYIFAHLHGKITVQEIADAIGLDPNYLSALFHRSEHVTIKQYILKEKISLIQKMLMYSPYSYIEIATYLGFSSQSHMGADFKRMTGMTPKQFRTLYQKKEFLSGSNDV